MKENTKKIYSSKYISAKIPQCLNNEVDKLLESGLFENKSKLIRSALCDLLKRENNKKDFLEEDAEQGKKTVRVHTQDFRKIFELLIKKKGLFFAKSEIFRCAIRDSLQKELEKKTGEYDDIKYKEVSGFGFDKNEFDYYSIEIPQAYDNAISRFTTNRSEFVNLAMQEYLAKVEDFMKKLEFEDIGKGNISVFIENYQEVEQLVSEGRYTGDSEVIRCAIREYLYTQLKSKALDEQEEFIEVPYILEYENGEKVRDLKKYRVIRKLS